MVIAQDAAAFTQTNFIVVFFRNSFITFSRQAGTTSRQSGIVGDSSSLKRSAGSNKMYSSVFSAASFSKEMNTTTSL